MRSTNSVVIRVEGPSKGLLTRFPPDLQDEGKIKYIVAAENVRAEKNQLRSAPGYERIATPLRALKGVPNLIYQANLTGTDSESKHTPVIGTETELLVMDRRSATFSCLYENTPGTGTPGIGTASCNLRFVATGNGGKIGSALDGVSDMLFNRGAGVVLYAGNLTSAASINSQDFAYQDTIFKKYGWAMSSRGLPPEYKSRPNRFFPVPGILDYTDATIGRFWQAFPAAKLLATVHGYSVKRGPVEFFFVDSVGPQTGAPTGVGNADLSSTGPAGQWLQSALAASDCPWRVVVWHHPPASSATGGGFATMDWPLGPWGADVLITAGRSIYERILRADGVTHFNVGTGGIGLGTLGTTATGSIYRNNTEYMALSVDVTQTSFAASGYTSDKILRDSVTLKSSRSYSTCYVEGSAPLLEAESLEILPSSLVMAQGQKSKLSAFAKINGTLVDVTVDCIWSSANGNVSVETIGTSGTPVPGRVTANNITSSTTITAQYQGIQATAAVRVVAKDLQKAFFSLVLDTSGSMNLGETAEDTVAPHGTRLDRLKEAVSIFLDSLQEKDEVSLTHFATNAEILLQRTTDFESVRQKVNGLAASGFTNTSEGLSLGLDALTASVGSVGFISDFPRSNPNFQTDPDIEDPRPTIVLFTDGMANYYGNPPVEDTSVGFTDAFAAAYTQVQNIRSAGWNLIVIAFDIEGQPTSLQNAVKGWASKIVYPTESGVDISSQACSRFFYSLTNVTDIPAIFTKLRSEIGTTDGCSTGGVPGIP